MKNGRVLDIQIGFKSDEMDGSRIPRPHPFHPTDIRCIHICNASTAHPTHPNCIHHIRITSTAHPTHPECIHRIRITSTAHPTHPKCIHHIRITSTAHPTHPKCIQHIRSTSATHPRLIQLIRSASITSALHPMSIQLIQSASITTASHPLRIQLIQSTSITSALHPPSIQLIQSTSISHPQYIRGAFIMMDAGNAGKHGAHLCAALQHLCNLDGVHVAKKCIRFCSGLPPRHSRTQAAPNTSLPHQFLWKTKPRCARRRCWPSWCARYAH